jgi:hypothetical protein
VSRPSDITTSKKTMLENLEKALGVVTVAAHNTGIHRDTHYRWMKEDEEYKAKVASLKEVTVDFAEAQLHKLIKEGNVAATIFFLKTQGKSRGYIERQEVTGADGAPIIEIIGNI